MQNYVAGRWGYDDKQDNNKEEKEKEKERIVLYW